MSTYRMALWGRIAITIFVLLLALPTIRVSIVSAPEEAMEMVANPNSSIWQEDPSFAMLLIFAVIIMLLYIWTLNFSITPKEAVYSLFFIPIRRISLRNVKKLELRMLKSNKQSLIVKYEIDNVQSQFRLGYINGFYKNYKGLMEELELYTKKKIKKVSTKSNW